MILLTGASGFVGQAVLALLLRRRPVRVALGQPVAAALPKGVGVVEASLSPDQDWIEAFSGVSSVVHCAARVHVMNEEATDPLAEVRRVTVDGTRRLAGQAAEAGVGRFVFVSSINVNGEHSEPGHPFTADQAPAPVDPFGVSKCEAEAGLRALSQETGMEVVIIPPPLVYGPGVKANFLAMMRWLQRGAPLPRGGVMENWRSLVFLDNLVDLIVTCIDYPAAANKTFSVSDDEDLSTVALLRCMAAALGRPARLIPVLAGLITMGSKLIGRPGIIQCLCSSLQVDIGKTRALLGWWPPFSVDKGFRRTLAHWLALQKASRRSKVGKFAERS